jgi:hypothetical protein
MKRNINILVVFTVIATLLFSVSCKNRIRDDEAAGTIGKVEKYRREQMTEKDILLRSEVMKDTTKLDEIIQGLIVFNAYASALQTSLNNRLLDMEAIQGFDEKYDAFINELTDFRDFLKNNNEVLTTTVYMLCDFHKDTISESSADVEKNLRLFSNYVNQMQEKDSILTVMVNNLDTYISENEQAIVDKAEVEKLKSIRDELLIRVIQESAVFNDPIALKSVGEKVLYNIDNLSAICNLDQLRSILSSAGSLSNIYPVASAILSGSDFIASDQAVSPSGGQGGDANSPVKPPSDADFGTGVPLVVQGFVVADQVFVNNVDSYADVPALNVYIVGFSVVGAAAASEQLQQSEFLFNIDVVGNAFVAAQEFIQNTESLQGDIIEPL